MGDLLIQKTVSAEECERFANALTGRECRCDPSKLYTICVKAHGVPEQHQGEPLFWRYRSGPSRAWTETTDRGQVESATKAGWIVEALYTHGDTSEAEELRKENKSLRDGWYKDECGNNRFWPEELQEAKEELAERDALLQDLLDYDISARARHRIEEALSASAEPSVPVDIDERAGFDPLEWLETEITAVDTWHRGSPSYEHDAGWMKDQALRLVAEARAALERKS